MTQSARSRICLRTRWRIMRVDHLLPMVEHLHEFVRIPGGVERLRSAVLEMAVSGALVPGVPDEGTGDELAAKMHIPPFAPEGMGLDLELSDIPERWCRVSLAAVTSKIGSGSTPRGGKAVYVKEGPLFLRSQNVWDSGLRLDDVAHITEAVHAAMKGTAVASDDVLLNITGASIGRSAIVPSGIGEANVSQHVMIVRPIDPRLAPFLHLSLIAPFFQRFIFEVQVGISRQGLSKRQAGKLPVPLPPLGEQGRIVEKARHLLGLIDQLHAQLVA